MYQCYRCSSPTRTDSDSFLGLKAEPDIFSTHRTGLRIRKAIPRTPLRTFFLSTATVVKCPSGCRFWCDKVAVFDRKIKERPFILYLLHFVNRLNPFTKGYTALKLLRRELFQTAQNVADKYSSIFTARFFSSLGKVSRLKFATKE